MHRHSIPGGVRAQLMALGIHDPEHTIAALSGYFPRELNIGASGLDGEGMARVLVHLATHGLISLPAKPGACSLRPVRPGWHFCRFYRDDEQLIELVAPYVAEGLLRNEAALWVLPNPKALRAAREALGCIVPDVDARFESGQLELLPHRVWYLDAKGRFKSFEEIAGALLAKQDQALAKGFSSLRAAGDAGWVSGTEQSKDFIEYEKKVDAALGGTKIAAVCTFRADATADELIAIIAAHQHAFATSA